MALAATQSTTACPEQDDAALIAAIQRGDELAFKALTERYQEPLFRFLMLHAHSHADVHDALQETWLAVFRHLNTFDQRRNFSTWLYTIAQRKLRRPGRLERLMSEQISDESPLETILRAESQDNIWITARRTLGPEQLSALWFCYACDLSTAEIGSILGRSTSWVKVNLYRARQLLRQELELSEA